MSWTAWIFDRAFLTTASAVLTVGAAAWAAYLIAASVIFGWLRSLVLRTTGSQTLYDAIRCRWCVGFWTSLAAVSAAWWYHALPWTGRPLLALTACVFGTAYLVGWLADHEN